MQSAAFAQAPLQKLEMACTSWPVLHCLPDCAKLLRGTRAGSLWAVLSCCLVWNAGSHRIEPRCRILSSAGRQSAVLSL